MKKGAVCPHCGAKMVEYQHSLNTPLLRALAKLYQHGRRVNLKELGLARNEWDNFQKLKYWDLVFQVEVDGKRKKGVWWLTTVGAAFVRGEISIPKAVWTYRGERVRYEGDKTCIGDFLGSDWTTRPEYAQNAQPRPVGLRKPPTVNGFRSSKISPP